MSSYALNSGSSAEWQGKAGGVRLLRLAPRAGRVRMARAEAVGAVAGEGRSAEVRRDAVRLSSRRAGDWLSLLQWGAPGRVAGVGGHRDSASSTCRRRLAHPAAPGSEAVAAEEDALPARFPVRSTVSVLRAPCPRTYALKTKLLWDERNGARGKKAFATLRMSARAVKRVQRELRGHALGDRAGNGKRLPKLHKLHYSWWVSLEVVCSCLPWSSVIGTDFGNEYCKLSFTYPCVVCMMKQSILKCIGK